MLDSVTLGRDDQPEVLGPGRLWNLWDMYKILALEFIRAVRVLQMFGDVIRGDKPQ